MSSIPKLTTLFTLSRLPIFHTVPILFALHIFPTSLLLPILSKLHTLPTIPSLLTMPLPTTSSSPSISSYTKTLSPQNGHTSTSENTYVIHRNTHIPHIPRHTNYGTKAHLVHPQVLLLLIVLIVHLLSKLNTLIKFIPLIQRLPELYLNKSQVVNN